jgi:diphthamide synthase (EF-2-diphthine--ammonia ligase)
VVADSQWLVSRHRKNNTGMRRVLLSWSSERGEFHTFCFAGPMFASEIVVQAGATVSRDGFCFIDLAPKSCATE